ncbi:hypothetical protein ABBQ38_001296 [Trebouxia sp. C0009 RCD-2024]
MRARGSNAGFLTVEYMGKREQLPASSKGSQISPRLAEVVVKQLDPRWARQGATAALLQAAGYSTDVAVQTEFTGDLPAHLSCWSHHLGRSFFFFFFFFGQLVKQNKQHTRQFFFFFFFFFWLSLFSVSHTAAKADSFFFFFFFFFFLS